MMRISPFLCVHVFFFLSFCMNYSDDLAVILLAQNRGIVMIPPGDQKVFHSDLVYT